MSSLASLVSASGPLRRGDREPDIGVLQAALGAAGYRITIDNDFGPATENAVKSFQDQHGLAIKWIPP